mmetsp:Transcript_6703/g.10551  ORF Transcript_6703/g.10551 Transcript_6703/m.10551 type:complete len:93 (-) Transcript_6703:1011-1289(-)
MKSGERSLQIKPCGSYHNADQEINGPSDVILCDIPSVVQERPSQQHEELPKTSWRSRSVTAIVGLSAFVTAAAAAAKEGTLNALDAPISCCR